MLFSLLKLIIYLQNTIFTCQSYCYAAKKALPESNTKHIPDYDYARKNGKWKIRSQSKKNNKLKLNYQ